MLETPNCFIRHCKHYLGVKRLGEEEITEVQYCRAFPDGIPGDIAYGDNRHYLAYPGDHGVRFMKIKSTPPRLATGRRG